MFWSKLCKSNWNCAWNLAFPFFYLTYCMEYMWELICYWSIDLSFGSFLGKILRWDRPCVNKSISIFHCNSVLFSQASNFHTSTMEDTDHKDVWQCGTFPWPQSLLVGFGIGALLAYNFIQLDRLLQTRLNQKEMAVTFLQLPGKIWLQEAILLLI